MKLNIKLVYISKCLIWLYVHMSLFNKGFLLQKVEISLYSICMYTKRKYAYYLNLCVGNMLNV